jgi:hypothetical protein
MSAKTSAGTILRVSNVLPTTNDVAGYEDIFNNSLVSSSGSLTGPAIVGEITDIGEFGREYSLITHKPLMSRGTQKYKGSFNEGTIALTLALDENDDGQIMMMQAQDMDEDCAFNITLSDGGNIYFSGKVMSFKINVGNVDAITTATSSIEITTDDDGVGIIYDWA